MKFSYHFYDKGNDCIWRSLIDQRAMVFTVGSVLFPMRYSLMEGVFEEMVVNHHFRDFLI